MNPITSKYTIKEYTSGKILLNTVSHDELTNALKATEDEALIINHDVIINTPDTGTFKGKVIDIQVYLYDELHHDDEDREYLNQVVIWVDHPKQH